MKIVILDTTFDLTVKGLYSLVRHAAILIIASYRSIAEINFAVDVTCSIKICIKVKIAICRGESSCRLHSKDLFRKEKEKKNENKEKRRSHTLYAKN